MLNSMEQMHPSRSVADRRPLFGKLEFSSIERFMEDAEEDHVRTVHLDVFEVSQQSELSFVYYVTLTVFVTAEDDVQKLLYEYSEEVGTVASTDRRCSDETMVLRARQRIAELEELLVTNGFDVKHGRLTVSRRD
ncbi:hypothetical protein [Alicyclobacillus mengziensis]|uniref:Uncharacterized protein n=1 Tax=Alicyclobacillus mengziensis TaxID=2931921 RepID=A0A9X7VYY6_9BACL|nr:hypothetical protein [Alicyclobacillus mengziensis]QSO46268.1 hypothetical protein JZ786_17425 [Alicyclobacillus mengziensis]